MNSIMGTFDRLVGFDTTGSTVNGIRLRFIKNRPGVQQHWVAYSYNNRPWSKSEIDVIIEHGPTHTARDLTTFFTNRSIRSINNQRSKLGVKYVRKNLWSDIDMSMLNDHAEFPITTLCKVFPNRTRNAIKNKLKRMKLC